MACHGPEKTKAELRLDSFASTMKGSDSGDVVAPGALADSELFRRIALPEGHEDVMPSEGKPLLSADEIRTVQLWIQAGASETAVVSEFPDAPRLKPAGPTVPLAPDWRPFAATLGRLEQDLGLKLVPRSLTPTDGLILRTASAPLRCDDKTLDALAPVAELIVEAELARTQLTDAGLTALARFANLHSLDLTRTKVTSAGLAALAPLEHLEALNLTETAVDNAGVEHLGNLPALKRVWSFGTKVSQQELE